MNKYLIKKALGNKTNGINKRKIVLIILTLMLLAILFSVYCVYRFIILHNAYFSIISAVNTSLGILDEEGGDGEGTKKSKKRKAIYVTEDGRTVFGEYPKDDNLRIRQEMLEICDKAGEVYGIPGKLVIAVAMAEAHGAITSQPKVETLNGKTGSMYTHLSLDYITGSGGRSFFKDNGNKNKYKNSAGQSIEEDYKVGTVDPSVSGATGLFQFEVSGIKGLFTRMYIEKEGKAEAQNNVPIMSQFDDKLGFMRPNPLYFPDQALNAAAKIKSHMDQYSGQLGDIKQSLPENVKQEILFIYAMDRYRGTLDAKGKNGRDMHRALGNLYADVYSYYSKGDNAIQSLGDFSMVEYNKTAIRALAVGQQSGTELSGHLSGNISVGGRNFTQTFIDKFTNTQPHNLNYEAYFSKVNNMGNSMNRLGVAHGFEGLNAATYYIALWTKQINEAEKITIGDGDNTGVVTPGEGKFMWPTPNYNSITSKFGWRFIFGGNNWHTGIDIGAPSGAKIVASKSGVLTCSSVKGTYGNCIKIDHGNGEVTLYAHLSAYEKYKGEQVKQGDTIGYVGSTGRSTGPHLHFEVIINGKQLDPSKYL